jgi:hypothetical protein
MSFPCESETHVVDPSQLYYEGLSYCFGMDFHNVSMAEILPEHVPDEAPRSVLALWQQQLLLPLHCQHCSCKDAKLIYGDAAAAPTSNAGTVPGLSICHKGGAATIGAAGCVLDSMDNLV